jgi:hypothetical protein
LGLRLETLTESIVTALQALAPERALNQWFTAIVKDGTGWVFEPEDNARWLADPRPIVEAFFHAKYFLGMAGNNGMTLLAPSLQPFDLGVVSLQRDAVLSDCGDQRFERIEPPADGVHRPARVASVGRGRQFARRGYALQDFLVRGPGPPGLFRRGAGGQREVDAAGRARAVRRSRARQRRDGASQQAWSVGG